MTIPLFRSEQTSYVNDYGVTVIQRETFAREYFNYKNGEHVVFGGPSTRGKTTLAFDLLEYCATPSAPAYIAVSKPRDKVTAERGEALGFRRVTEWPPEKKLNEYQMFGGKKPAGYLIWPPFGDLNVDMERCADLTRKLIMERYANGAKAKSEPGKLVMDDTMVKAKIMGLDKEMVTILAMAGAMDLGLWIFVQKPTDSGRTTVWGYENAIHLFFTKGGDKRMKARYVEILGDKGQLGNAIIDTLGPYQFLYCNKVEGFMCIVGAKDE